MFSAFPKIFALGSRPIGHIFEGPIEITEKVDGSQFGFAKMKGVVVFRSKGQQIFSEEPPSLFKPSCDHIQSIAHIIPEDFIFYGEALCRNRHNILAYDRTPLNNIALFAGVKPDGAFMYHEEIDEFAKIFNIEAVPKMWYGIMKDDPVEFLQKLLDTTSFLGGTKIEGVVIKNYGKDVLVGGQYLPICSGKFVSEAFKEKHKKDWKNSGDKLRDIFSQYHSEARWHKAIQRMKEDGSWSGEPKDIGPLLKAINIDLIEEEKESIKEDLWNMYHKDFFSVATKGFPEWYKLWLVAN